MDAAQGYGPLISDVRRIAEQFFEHMNAGAREQVERGVEVGDCMVNHCLCRECRFFVKHVTYSAAYDLAGEIMEENAAAKLAERTAAAETNLSAFLDKLLGELSNNTSMTFGMVPFGTARTAFPRPGETADPRMTPKSPMVDVCACGQVHK